MDLQTAFYIIGIVFMSLMLLVVIGIAITVLVIKAKINDIHRRIEEKLAVVTNITHLGSDIVAATKKVLKRG
jgi:hypothetical protein